MLLKPALSILAGLMILVPDIANCADRVSPPLLPISRAATLAEKAVIALTPSRDYFIRDITFIPAGSDYVAGIEPPIPTRRHGSKAEIFAIVVHANGKTNLVTRSWD